MDSNDFKSATIHFVNAASLAKEVLESEPNNGNAKHLFTSLIHLARKTQTMGNESSEQLAILKTSSVNLGEPSQVIYNTFPGSPIIHQGVITEKSDAEEKIKRRLKPIKNASTKRKQETKQAIQDLLFSYQAFDPEKRRMFGTEMENLDQLNFHIGLNVDDDKQTFWNPSKLMNGIVTITGGSGSGKTQCLRLLADKLTRANIPCLIFDLHGDIDIGIPTLSMDYTGEFGINPMELTSKSKQDGGPTPHINRLMTQFSYAVKNPFSSTQSAWVRHLLNFAYFDHGILQKDPTTWNKPAPDFRYLVNLIKRPEEIIMNSGNEEFIRYLDMIKSSTRIAVENRLVSILEHPAFFAKDKVPIDTLKSVSHRILLKPLNTIDMQFLASDTLIRQIFAHFKSIGHIKEGEQRLRLFIIIDEVKVLTGYRGKMNDPYHILNVIATEARKFGIGMILASQVLGHFGRDIRSNAATKLILRSMDNDETKRASKELKIKKDLIESITSPGEGYLITSRDSDATHVQLLNFST